MSRYKLIMVSKTEEKETQSLYSYDDLDAATTDMHNYFGAALKTPSTLSVYCVIVDNETATCAGICTYPRIIGDYNSSGESMAKYAIKQRVYTHNDFSDDNIAPYDSDQLAVGNFHTKVASARNKLECKHAVVIRLSKTGEYADSYCYNA